ncbi:hypothetical protein [Pseudomonas sp. nanlin1]|uniref:FimV/HubP-related protein n=1 Tax=Pseudomonas sp. nanlin1 TaxID=3040605 RepID=UPI0038911607
MRERSFSCFRSLAPSPRLHAAGLSGLLAIALLHAPGALALGLGDITLRSALNQPFKADIELLDTAGLDESDVMASLATQEEFAKAGVERVFFLNDLRFTPDFRGARKVIHVTSNKVVTEPYLNFLIQVSRPNGQLMREFTVLLDPPGSAQAPVAMAADAPPTRAANAAPARPPAAAAPAPNASQGKRYTIAQGDSLWTIGKSLQASGTPGSTEQLIRGIRALNPGSEPLQVGKSLLLPDSAVLNADPAVQAPAAPDAAPAATLNALNERLLELENQLAVKDQQMAALATQLAEAKTQSADPAPGTPSQVAPEASANAVVPAAPSPAQPAQVAPVAPATAVAPAQPQPTQVTPTAPPSPAVADSPAALSPVPQPMDDEGLPWWQILAVVALLALLVALLLINRRNKRAGPAKLVAVEPQARSLVKPAQRVPVPEPVAPAVAAAPVAAVQAPVPARRESPAATDALDGASIYIAYGRFNEALGILREGLAKQPHRTDLHVRMLEVLGQQGNAEGFAVEEAHLRKSGFDPLQLDEIRARYPQIAASGAAPQRAEPGLAALAALAAASAAAASAPKPEAVEPAVQQEDPIGEFQLNLDDFNLDADLGLVSPFEAPAPAPVETPDSVEEGPVDEGFFLETDLNTFPDVEEVADEGLFLSDLDADEGEGFLQVDPPAENLDDAFLDGFIDADDLPELDALTVDFDDLESQQMSAQLLEEAQTHIDSGNLTAASKLLHDLLRDGDDSCKHTARQLLASIE